MKYPNYLTFELFQQGKSFTFQVATEPLAEALKKQFSPPELMRFINELIEEMDDEVISEHIFEDRCRHCLVKLNGKSCHCTNDE